MYSTAFTNTNHDVTTVKVVNSLKCTKLNILEQNMIFPGSKKTLNCVSETAFS